MIDNPHRDVIAEITQKEFAAAPSDIVRMGNGVCNEVYSLTVNGRDAIMRLNAEPRFMLGSRAHIPLFREKGIRVPDILAEDYSKASIPFAYQIMSRIEGRDIGEVIETLTDDQLRGIGGEVANIFRKLSEVPNNGKFGVLWGDDRDLVDSWPAEVQRVTRIVLGWGKKTGVLDGELEGTLEWVNHQYREYFEQVRPLTYFGDLSSKNVMVHEGRFVGLVDLDSLAQGDPLEAIGRIKASWYGTHHGEVYTDSIMNALGLEASQRKLVTMYALLNRSFWTLENGVRFNRNTSGRVDWGRAKRDKAIVGDLFNELRDTAKTTRAVAVHPQEIPSARPMIDDTPPEEPSLVAVSNSLPVTLAPDLAAPPIQRPVSQTVLLEASGVSKTYVSDGIGFDALSNVDLRVTRGDCIAIVGKSGSGKSTLMHMLACLDVPTEGYVYVDGDETSTMSEPEKNRLRNEKFGFVFQQFFLNGRDTVFENVVLPMRIRGASDFEMITEADESLAAVGLSDKTHKKAKDLSGGEKQRVCIARALVGKPQVIFADEPTGNLDSNTGAAVENMLFELNRQKGITLVIVTHDAELAQRCSRIVEMRDGRIIAERAGEASHK